MKTMKSTLSLALILYLCASLSGVPFVLSASAKIITKSANGATGLITIVKGDSLWKLAIKHLNDPLRWKEFKNYNNFTNPDLIYPDEKLRIPLATARELIGILETEGTVSKSELEELKKLLEEANTVQESTGKTVGNLEKQMAELREQNRELHSNLESLSGDVKQSSEANAQAVDKLHEALASEYKEAEEEIGKISTQIEALQKSLDQRTAELAEQKMNANALNTGIQSLSDGMNQNQKALGELDELIRETEGDVEPPSKQKRTFAILAAVAGGLAWFAVNSIGRD